MKLTELFGFSGEPFSYYPGLVRRLGVSVNASVLLCFLAWRDSERDAEGWRSLNASDIETRTGLTVKEQATARKQLVSAGLIEEIYARLEHKLRFRLIAKEIAEDEGPSKWPFDKSANGETPNEQMANFPNGVSLKEEEIDKEEDKKGGITFTSKRAKAFQKPTLEEVVAFAMEIGLSRSDGEAFFYGKEGNGWRNGSQPVKDWRATVRQWKACGYHPSQKTTKEARQQKPDLHFEL